MESFSDLHLREDVVDALNSIGLPSPTITQVRVACCVEVLGGVMGDPGACSLLCGGGVMC